MTVPEGASPGQQLEVQMPPVAPVAEQIMSLQVPEGAAPGERVKFGAWDAEQSDAHTENQMKKKKTWEKVVDDLCTTDGCVAAYKDLEMVTSAGPVTCASITGGTVG